MRTQKKDTKVAFELSDFTSANGGKISSAPKLVEYEKLLVVPDTISASMTDFAFDTSHILKRRIEIANAIEEILKSVK